MLFIPQFSSFASRVKYVTEIKLHVAPNHCYDTWYSLSVEKLKLSVKVEF